MSTLKSIGAVLAGLLFTIIVTTIVDIILHYSHAYPPMGQAMSNAQAVLASSYRIIITIIAAYLTAKFSPGKPMRDALILGCVGLLLGVVGAVATWNSGLGPRWYAVSLAVLALPECWLGARLYLRQHAPVTPGG